jgi:hypothetical protein
MGSMTIRPDVLDWLLEPNNPPVRFQTLTCLLDRDTADAEVRRARDDLPAYRLTQTILEHPNAVPLDDRKPYWDYAGLYWQLILLGEFFADGTDPRVARAVRFVLEHRHWVQKSKWQCLTASMLAALMRLGYGDDPIVVAEVEALAQRAVAEDGIDCSEIDYSLLTRCYMGLPKLLLCFAEVPPERRSPTVERAIDRIVAQMLDRHVFIYVPGRRATWNEIVAARPKRPDLPQGQRVKDWVAERRTQFLAERGPGKPEPKRGWLTFSFPPYYNSDILEALVALARVGTPHDAQLDRALEVVVDRRTEDGRWLLDRSINGKTLVDIEAVGAPSKWLTFRALYVLKHFGIGDA